MKVTSETIGNYSINSIRAKKNISASRRAESVHTDTINQNEKDFFMKLYPENKEEIMDFHFYGRSGKMSGVNLGKLIDKRG